MSCGGVDGRRRRSEARRRPGRRCVRRTDRRRPDERHLGERHVDERAAGVGRSVTRRDVQRHGVRGEPHRRREAVEWWHRWHRHDRLGERVGAVVGVDRFEHVRVRRGIRVLVVVVDRADRGGQQGPVHGESVGRQQRHQRRGRRPARDLDALDVERGERRLRRLRWPVRGPLRRGRGRRERCGDGERSRLGRGPAPRVPARPAVRRVRRPRPAPSATLRRSPARAPVSRPIR